ncbi:MAG: AAA family ATPase, partial [Candidatus Binatia bacterium]
MRIRKLELCGFKSFVEPTALELSPGISAIVGPNGCGKSNLVDALRWVLGEQSPSRLRGDGMEDVIFNGSANRGPVGMAEVSLLLENDGERGAEELPEYLRDVPEILVSRRYFRSGESEYLINRRVCRLKDITELFLGTGVGTRAYAMIEQGRVDQLVNAKPEDLRLFIEEAAGTTRYRSRRLAAERKMERTKENLARVNDILQEIERNIALFRRMAKRAEQYRVWQQELRTVELQLARRRFDRLTEEIAAIEGVRDELRRREAEILESIARAEEEREAARRALGGAETELRERQEAVFALRSARERSETRLEMLEREDREAEERVARILREREQMRRRRGELREEAARRGEEMRALASERSAREAELATSLRSATEEEVDVLRLADALEKAKTDIVELLGREAELRNRIAAAERRAAEQGERRTRLLAELET